MKKLNSVTRPLMWLMALVLATVVAGCGGSGSSGGGSVSVSSAKAITAYSLAGSTGTINEVNKTIAVTKPFGTDVTALVATFTTTGASVTVGTTVQTSATTPNNFTSPVVYTVTAADGTTVNYTVTVTVASATAKAITAYSFVGFSGNAGVIDEAAKTIAVTLPTGTPVTALVATFTTTGTSVSVGATPQVSGTTANDFTSPVAYIVTDGNAATVTYTVTVTPASATDKAITAYSFVGFSGNAGVIDEATKAIAVTLPTGTGKTALIANFVTTGASVTVGGTTQESGTTQNNFTSPVAYLVTAGDASTATYTVTVTVAGGGTLTLTANAPIVTEPATGTKAMTFVLTLDSAPLTPVTVTYATQTGTATSDVDFVAATGTVNFAIGQTVATVSVVVNNDADAESSDETVPVLFSGADLVASVTGTGTILANGTTGAVAALAALVTDTTASLGLGANDDTVTGTIDQATPANGSLEAVDTFNGGAGTDRLELTPTTAALILDDLLFAGVTGFDKIVINTTSAGAQTITGAKPNFYAAFGTAGVDLDTTSTDGAMTIDTSPFAGPTTLAATSTTGAQAITTGTGVTTVTSSASTGSRTINSAAAVVASVTMTVNADSAPANTIITGAGNDTITITGAGIASTNGNVITGGLGADTITLAINASKDNIVIADGDTGITVATADSITNFTAGQDFLTMGLAGDAANYAEAGVAVADFAAALTAANQALNGTVLYSFQFVGSGPSLVGYLFKDTNADGTADEVVVLVGVDYTLIDYANIK